MSKAIEGYASATSVFPGETIDFHLRCEAPGEVTIEVFRVGRPEGPVATAKAQVGDEPVAADAYASGCDWPVSWSLAIPPDWPSAVHIARVRRGGAATDILFVVKSAAPGRKARTLVQLAVNTYQAYNNWGGKSLYCYNSSDAWIDWGGRQGVASTRVSFDRPCPLTNFASYEAKLIAWLLAHRIDAEYCTSIDLHADAGLLGDYRLLVSVGHDEYWSKEMRDNVESFTGSGGNVAFLGGNVCWFQVRFEDNHRTMVCHKNDGTNQGAVEKCGRPRDPLWDSPDPAERRLVTVRWRDPPVDRPENAMTGVSYFRGAGRIDPSQPAPPPVPYTVRSAGHWVFDGTGLQDGDRFGAEDQIVGYETDAGVPGEDGTPADFLVLADADCTSWGKSADEAEHDWSTRGSQGGMATMGIFQKGGTVFTAATTDWCNGLKEEWNSVAQITSNVLRRLSSG